MPAFLNRVFKRDYAASKKSLDQPAADEKPAQPKYVDGWLRTEVAPEEVQELLRGCTHEVKLRGLSTPFLLLPYRPNTDTSAARTLIRSFFNPQSEPLTGAFLQQELRLTEPEVLCSAIKWCWSRLPGGVVTWDVYELFRQGEVDSSMARDSFATFIPISAESEARSKIIFDYFDLLSAIAAHGKHNGLGGLKLSRLAGWWAFEHSDTGFGFEGGYASWTSAAEATCHLFFAYLRSLSPADPSQSVTLLPTSLRALLASVDYPPVPPPQFQTRSIRVALTVDRVAPSPFALLRRAKHHQFQSGNSALRIFTDYEDPVRALSDECKRVLRCISSTGQSGGGGVTSAGLQDQSWSRFQDMGFSGLVEADECESDEDELQSQSFKRRVPSELSPSTPSREIGMEIARPTTPSWADFMDAGFGDRELSSAPAPLLLPPDKVLPPIETSRVKSSQSNKRVMDINLDPGELDTVAPIDIDDAFWWVWMSSLAGEETGPRKAVFGRCALVETNIKGVKWLVVEEKVRGAAKIEESPMLSKKDKKKSKKSKLRRKSVGRPDAPTPEPMKQFNPSMPSMNRSNIGPDQTAKIQAAAAALRQQQTDSEFSQLRRRSPREDTPATRTNSVFTLQPVIMSEATPAMKWASRYDRDTLREAYLKGTPLPEKRPLPVPEPERELPVPPKDPEPLPLRSESPTPPAPVKKDTHTLTPASPKANRHASMLPPSPASNGRASPVLEKRLSLGSSSPQSLNSVASSQDKIKPKVSRLRALFGKKAEVSETGGHLGIPLGVASRKLSVRRKHSPIEVSSAPHMPPPVAQPDLVATSGDDSPLDLVENKTTFVSFDQGPLEDVPAFIPDDSQESIDNSTASPSPPAKDDAPSEPSPPGSPTAPVQDRWAQIRKNAAERAKVAPKAAEEGDGRGSLEDGDTSGEESLESRVARIRARVAVLTGNAEGETNRT
ncbi:hypothetical protein EDC01DRAFT_16569 [Geopyxis carbonaria]|nr:hypothetical protein EDC01DRAFT_16569 [Geopyxis carbonaria]